MARPQMAKRDARIDTYIAQAAPFAKPILAQIRDVVHEAVPEVIETMKWSHPSFDHHGIVCGMAAFKAHCVLNFWKAPLLDGKGELFRREIKTVDDLPGRREFVRLVRQAAKLNEDGVKVPEEPRKAPQEKRALNVPDDLIAALRKNKKALAAWEAFSYSNQKEYVEWITEAKAEETRQRRLETAVEWIAEDKPRNWKYMKK
jgi:uncharacterized protein YdeI (YjbR/CyaY-like superfamily)